MVQVGDILVNSIGIGTLGRTAQVKELKQELQLTIMYYLPDETEEISTYLIFPLKLFLICFF